MNLAKAWWRRIGLNDPLVFWIVFNRILKGPGVVIPLIFHKVPQSSQTESLGFRRVPPLPLGTPRDPWFSDVPGTPGDSKQESCPSELGWCSFSMEQKNILRFLERNWNRFFWHSTGHPWLSPDEKLPPQRVFTYKSPPHPPPPKKKIPYFPNFKKKSNLLWVNPW